ncbi:MAG: M48 family metalloprotease [bacterium]
MNNIRCSFLLFIFLLATTVFGQDTTAKGYAPDDFMRAVSKDMNNAKYMTARDYNGTNSRLIHNVVEKFTENGMIKNYRIYVMETKDWNAFASAGMSSPDVVCVWTGLLDDMKTEDELAGVIAHEITHNNHQDASSEVAKLTAASVINAIIFGDDGKSATSQGMLLLFMQKGFSRTQEYRADREGLVMAVKAGYDPRATVDLWNKMADKYPNSDPKIFLDHPASKDRANTLDKIVKENMKQGADGKWLVVTEPTDPKGSTTVTGRFGKAIKAGLFTGVLGAGYGGLMLLADSSYSSSNLINDSGKWALSGFAVSLLLDIDLPALKNKDGQKQMAITAMRAPNGEMVPCVMVSVRY